jgi:hypothetical protein
LNNLCHTNGGSQKEIAYGNYKNTKKRKNGKFGLTLAVLVLLPLFLLRLAAGQIASAQPAGNQSQPRYTSTDLGTLGASFSGAPAIYNQALI